MYSNFRNIKQLCAVYKYHYFSGNKKIIISLPRSGFNLIATTLRACKAHQLGLSSDVSCTPKFYSTYFDDFVLPWNLAGMHYPVKNSKYGVGEILHDHNFDKLLMPFSSGRKSTSKVVVLHREPIKYIQSRFKHLNMKYKVLDGVATFKYELPKRVGCETFRRVGGESVVREYLTFQKTLEIIKKNTSFQDRILVIKSDNVLSELESNVKLISEFFNLQFTTNDIEAVSSKLLITLDIHASEGPRYSKKSVVFERELIEYLNRRCGL